MILAIKVRYLLFLGLLGMAVGVLAAGQAAPANATVDPVMPKDPIAAMLLAARVNGLGSPDMKPWHLKANYQTFDADGRLKDQGVFEEWWAGPEKWKVSYTSAGFNQVEYRNGEKDMVTGDAGWVPLPDSMVERYLIHPLPPGSVIKKEKYVAIDEKICKATLGCLRPLTSLNFTVCLSMELPGIRVEKYRGGLNVLFNKVVQLNGHYAAEQIQVGNSDLPIVSADVTALEGLSRIEDAEFVPPASARPVPVRSGEAGVIGGHWLSESRPEYPMMARKANIDGTVMLSAVITKAGTTDDIRVISGPRILQDAAIEAVKTWRCTPYLLDKKPVAIQVQVNVTFQHLGKLR